MKGQRTSTQDRQELPMRLKIPSKQGSSPDLHSVVPSNGNILYLYFHRHNAVIINKGLFAYGCNPYHY